MPDGLTDIKGRFSGVEEPETPGAALCSSGPICCRCRLRALHQISGGQPDHAFADRVYNTFYHAPPKYCCTFPLTHMLSAAPEFTLLKVSVRATLPVGIEAHGLPVLLHYYPFSGTGAVGYDFFPVPVCQLRIYGDKKHPRQKPQAGFNPTDCLR